MKVQLIGSLLVPIVSVFVAVGILTVIRPDLDLLGFLDSNPTTDSGSMNNVPPARTASADAEGARPAVRNRPAVASRSSKPAVDSNVNGPVPATTVPESTADIAPAAIEVMRDPFSELPDSVSLERHIAAAESPLIEVGVPERLPYSLFLVTQEFPEENGKRLTLEELESLAGSSVWQVYWEGDKRREDADPLGEFRWGESGLHFEWRGNPGRQVATLLNNGFLNVTIGEEEKLIQLRKPVQSTSLEFDLSQNFLELPIRVPDLPDADKLRMKIAGVELQNLQYRVDGEQTAARAVQKLTVAVTSPPGIRIQTWFTAKQDQLSVEAECHYWLGSTKPIELNQSRLESQTKSFVRQQRQANAAIPRLQNSLPALSSKISEAKKRLSGMPGGLQNALPRASLDRQIKGMQASLSAGQVKLERAKQTAAATEQGLNTLQTIRQLANTLQGQTPFHYQIFLPIEFDGVSLEVVLLDAKGSRSLEADESDPTFAFDGGGHAEFGERDPVPPQDAREAAREALGKEFRDRYQAAESDSEKRRLASELLKEADREVQDAARRLELFRLAWVIYIQAGELESALQAAEQAEVFYEIAHSDLHASIVRSAIGEPQFEERPDRVIDQLLAVVDSATLAKEYTIAHSLLRESKEKLYDTATASQADEIDDRLAYLDAESELAEQIEKLKANPEDQEKSLEVGLLALQQGHPWDECLLYLAKGNDATIAEVARRDLENPTIALEQTELGDAWFDLSETPHYPSARLLERAAVWYQKALPDLTGFSKERVEKRLESILPPEARSEPDRGNRRSLGDLLD